MCKDHPDEQIVGFNPTSKKFMCNSCIFEGKETPTGEEERSANNNIKIVSLMALELKNKFDDQFMVYKDNLGALHEYVNSDGSGPKFST